MLDLKDRGVYNLGVEISDFKAKNFRNEFISPASRIRNKVLAKNGFHMVEINTKNIPGYEEMADEQKGEVLKHVIL